jgi:hypothetical protein
VQRAVDDAEVHPLDISAPMLEPKCPAEASEESDEIVADDANNSPAIARGYNRFLGRRPPFPKHPQRGCLARKGPSRDLS